MFNIGKFKRTLIEKSFINNELISLQENLPEGKNRTIHLSSLFAFIDTLDDYNYNILINYLESITSNSFYNLSLCLRSLPYKIREEFF